MANTYSAEIIHPGGKKRYFFGLLGPIRRVPATIITEHRDIGGAPSNHWQGRVLGDHFSSIVRIESDEKEEDILSYLTEKFAISRLEAVANSFVEE